MQEITQEKLNSEAYLLFIHTPFCGTCHVAEAMLKQIESIHKQEIFLEMNASLHADFMQKHKIESVPCLLIKSSGTIQEKIYAFHSIPNIYSYLLEYKSELFR